MRRRPRPTRGLSRHEKKIVPSIILVQTDEGFTLSQATKALRESIGIALLYFRPLH
jgi:hypothetical protein